MKLSKIELILLLILAIIFIAGAVYFCNGYIITNKFPFIDGSNEKFDFKLFGAILGIASFIMNISKFSISFYSKYRGIILNRKGWKNKDETTNEINIFNAKNYPVKVSSVQVTGYIVNYQSEIDDFEIEPNQSKTIKFTTRKSSQVSDNIDWRGRSRIKLKFIESGSSKPIQKQIKVKL